MNVRFLVVCAVVGGCDLLPGAPDGGHTKVPSSYQDARLSPGHRAHLALTGEKQLACRDCHFIADAGFHAGAVKACAECHPNQQAHHHPFDGGTPMSCFSCHAFRAIGESAGIDKWGCVRCHAPQVSVHQEKCDRCHRPHGTPFTRAADCGQCHSVTVAHGKGEKRLEADTCMTCHPHHTRADVAATRCAECHAPKTKALFDRGHPSCATCHGGHRFTADTAKACTSCHADQPVLAPAKHAGCATCHDPHDERAAPKTCQSCHAKVHVDHPRDTRGQTCLGCHPVHAPTAAVSTAVPCTQCHAQIPAPVVHAGELGCATCHKAPHAGKPQRAGLCEGCHADQHKAVKKNPGHAKCDACHAGLPHAPPGPEKPCLECHAQAQPPQKGHASCDGCHASHSAQVIKKCTDCHQAPLPGLHAVKKHQKCESCHAPHVPEPGAGPKTCQSCHAKLSAKSHPTPPQQCVGCHLFQAR